MKRYLFLLLVLILPVFVYAETCDNSKIVISDVEKIENNGYVEEISNPVINGQSVSTNLKLYDIGDSITYKFKVKNNSDDDYDLRKNITSDENVSYELITDSTIKAGEEKEIKLKVTYQKRVDDSKYVGGKYVQNKELNILLGDNVVNPSTGLNNILIILVLTSFIIISLFLMKKDAKLLVLVIGVLLLIPSLVEARCQYRINISSNIEFKKVIPNDCRYSGELIDGDKYVNGQYTYTYSIYDETNVKDSKSSNDSEHVHLDSQNVINLKGKDGWSVELTDKESTNPVTTKLCTSINGKPIVSMNFMFEGSETTSIDFSSFDTSEVTDMGYMFANSQVTSLDLSNFDTSNVTTMLGMFAGSHVTLLDLSNFDTKNVTNMGGMFANSQVTSLDLSNFDTSNVLQMDGMFYQSKANTLELSNFDMRKVEDASYMFCDVNPSIIKKGKHFKELNKIYTCNKV